MVPHIIAPLVAVLIICSKAAATEADEQVVEFCARFVAKQQQASALPDPTTTNKKNPSMIGPTATLLLLFCRPPQTIVRCAILSTITLPHGRNNLPD